jgi:hypothetical protein
VLRAGDQVAAVTLSLRSAGVLHAWFTAYNPELERYSPGLVLFVWLAEQASSLGITKIDLGRGEERYKASLASAATEVAEGTLSTPSLGVWFRNGWRTSRDWLAHSPLNASLKCAAAGSPVAGVPLGKGFDSDMFLLNVAFLIGAGVLCIPVAMFCLEVLLAILPRRRSEPGPKTESTPSPGSTAMGSAVFGGIASCHA